MEQKVMLTSNSKRQIVELEDRFYIYLPLTIAECKQLGLDVECNVHWAFRLTRIKK